MSKWLLRGLVFAALMVFVRLLQGVLINALDTWALTISVTLVILFALGALFWGTVDGRADAQANPDPDRRGDLAMTWLLAGLVAGILSGLVSWVIAQFYDNLYAEGLLNEVTTFAAFTALVVFVAGVAGVALGRYLVDRKAGPFVRQRIDNDRADTDVFEAVRDEGQETVHAGAPASEETAPVNLEKNS
jgi:membrane protease YdiL (CAAX protease family)